MASVDMHARAVFQVPLSHRAVPRARIEELTSILLGERQAEHGLLVLQLPPGPFVAAREAANEAEVEVQRKLQLQEVPARGHALEARLLEQGHVPVETHAAELEGLGEVHLAEVAHLERLPKHLDLLRGVDFHLNGRALGAVHEHAPDGARTCQNCAVAAQGDARDRVLVADSLLAARELFRSSGLGRPLLPSVPLAVPSGREQLRPRAGQEHRSQGLPGAEIVAHAHQQLPGRQIEDPALPICAPTRHEPGPIVQVAPDPTLQVVSNIHRNRAACTHIMDQRVHDALHRNGTKQPQLATALQRWSDTAGRLNLGGWRFRSSCRA
mmetsp:Transcript_51770/g.146612  ORF Transcript_51770/g.146612 Transcript_51770/m.146612 type:complete len:325 (+) Transcript_51770:438-1412(+)